MRNYSYRELVDRCVSDYAPLYRCYLALVDGCIECEVKQNSEIAFTLDRMSRRRTESTLARLVELFRHRGVIVATRPEAWDELEGMNEVVPGVLIEDGSVHIVDHAGEVVMWDFNEFEDDDAILAALNAVAIAANRGPGAVREMLQRARDTK